MNVSVACICVLLCHIKVLGTSDGTQCAVLEFVAMNTRILVVEHMLFGAKMLEDLLMIFD